MAFIFGGNTPWTYEELKRQRELANMLATDTSAPRNVGEGLNAIGNALAYRGLTKRANKEEARMKGEFDSKWGEVFSGTAPKQPAFTPAGPPLPPPDPNSPHALGDATMAALGKSPVKTAADPASIKAGLVARGLPEHIADGFVMNMKDESGLNPGINEIAPLVPGSRGGFGLYQLTGPRRRAYEAYAAERGVPVDDVDAQLDFLMMELQGPEAAAWAKISGAQNAGEAGAAIVNHFLRPAEEHRSARAAEYLGSGGTPAQDNINLGALVELAGDPMATPAQKAIVEQLIAQQTTAADPMQALELEKARLELEAVRNPSAKPVELETFTGPDGKVYSFNPMSGETKPLTEAEAPKESARPMTAEEKAAWGIPETDTTPYKMTDNGPVAIGGGGVTVNNDMSGGGKFEEAFAKGDAATIETVYNSGLAAQRNIGRIDQLGALLEANPTGLGAAAKQFAGRLGIATEGLDEIQSAQAIINSLVPEQRQPGSGPMSDADLALFKQSLPQMINQPGGNKIIVDTMRAIAQYDAEGAQIVQRLRNGELTRAEAFEALQNRKNPLAEFKPPSQTEAAPSGSGAPEGIEQDVWDAMTPEERALWD